MWDQAVQNREELALSPTPLDSEWAGPPHYTFVRLFKKGTILVKKGWAKDFEKALTFEMYGLPKREYLPCMIHFEDSDNLA